MIDGADEIRLIAPVNLKTGQSRLIGYARAIAKGYVISGVDLGVKWPGTAQVYVDLTKVSSSCGSGVRLNSRLRPKPERKDPISLRENKGLSYVGTYVLGMGFTLTPQERDELVAKNPKNAERIFPYIGGKEVNTSPIQDFDRYVISFGEMTLEQAEQWPDLIGRVRELVKPERDKNKRAVRRKYWWRFGEVAPALYKAIAPLDRCLVTARVSKHVMFSFQPTNRILNEKLYVFPFDDFYHCALLQSRVHTMWAWFFSSTMRNAGINYSATTCFENFPFPDDDALTNETLETFAKNLYETRAKFMCETEQGLTDTYNLLKDKKCDDANVVELRMMHEEFDRMVLRAYGWDDIDVPPFTDPVNDAEQKAFQAFEDEVIDRLFVLNAERAE